MNNPFTLEILQAINDWQLSTTTARGKKLEKLCVQLPAEYRTVDFPCYRKINLKKDGVFSVFARHSLPERISSWSSSVDVVKSFKHGVSLKVGEQSFIYQTNPAQNEVILNLIAVYKSCYFHNALNQHRNNIKNIKLGIDRYKDSQSEVVLKKEVVTHKDIYMLGGRSQAFCISHYSDIKSLSLSNSVYDITTNTIIIFKWLTPEKTSKVISKVLTRYPQPFNVYSLNYGYVRSKK
ncbi:hypothetical protein [Ewingella americana]|uniref:hypothetical protein n=1 Tax=Ewingella americana TaxID=41202 RepID=UPI001639D924|nr:hypothetical protein [Ewingella americana]QMV50608.1 hypothetical protein GXP68_04025 [Ewingella americana]